MNTKSSVVLGTLVGSTLGGLIPLLWGSDNFLSFSSLFFEAVGSIVGIYIAFKLTH